MPHAYDDLITHVRETRALAQAAGILAWDQETMMPPHGAPLRAEQAAALGAALHARRTDPAVGDWLAALEGMPLPESAARNLTLIRRDHARATRLPATLSAALARATSAGRAVWAEARAAGRFDLFAPALARIVALKREEAACLTEPGQPLYDALLDDHEPGATAAQLMPLLESLHAPLSALRAGIAESPAAVPVLQGRFPAAAQLALAREIALAFGYRIEAGRIDLALHPFCSGTGGDVRITTRIDEAEPLGCLFSTIHETGHAVYEQNLPETTLLEPIGQHASMGVHESQSRLLENQIGRSRAFAGWLWPRFRAAFGDSGLDGVGALHAALNRVETGFIRTEADEVHYNLHIILRTRLERDLIEGRLEPADLEDAWNAGFAADFGRPVPGPVQGVLQDIHWSLGLFGYFPTYTLGNIYAAELFAAMRRDLGDLDGHIAQGELSALTGWLTQHVHRHANSLPPGELVTRAIGHAPTAAPLIAYLEAKFGALYGIGSAGTPV